MTVQAIRAPQNGIPPDAIHRFAASLRGRLVTPESPDYDEARAVYNAMIDRYPALIARCADVADVLATIAFARDHDLTLAVRGGGHNGAGLGTVEGGIVLDLSPMKGIRVDPIARTVRVEAGCTWAEVDHATHGFGLATPSGIIGSTGVAGLTLGGGLGHLSRRYGLTIDNLITADVALASGELVTTSEDEHPDLYWAIRGGGGNFGVVTSFLFRLHHVDTVIGGRTLWPLDQIGDAMRWYREFIVQAPVELNGFFTIMTVPPVTAFPAELHLQQVCGVVWCWTGPKSQAEAIFAPVRQVGTPLLHSVQEMPFPALQTAFDALYPAGLQWYWKTDFVRELPDAAIDLHLEHGRRMPAFRSCMHLYPIDGAVHRVDRNDTAFSYRDATWAMVIVGVDPDPANTGAISTWAQDYWEALHPYSAGGAYVNMLMEEGQDRIRRAYRDNYDRLAAIKARYDPANLFRVNQNIAPAQGASE